METPADPAARTFSQVLFTDIPHSYPPSTPVTCCYTLTEAFQPHPRDWVGIFKVGWSSAKDYHTFVWVEPCLDVVGGSVSREAVFKDYYLPKDEIDFYQFCYIDSSCQVRGASTPFCFRSPEGRSLDCSPDDDLLVITTQEQVERSVREKAELQKELDRIQEENECLKKALQKEQREAAIFKEQREKKEKEQSRLVSELDRIKEQNGNLTSKREQLVHEMDRLQEELLVQSTKQLEIQQQRNLSVSLSDGASMEKETHAREKYDRAVAKINQLKREREELRGKVDAQTEELSKLNCCLREGERELLKTKDSIELLQVDLQSSEKENERLVAELQRLRDAARQAEDVKRENRELCRRLSQHETQQDVPDDQLRKLVSQLQDAQVTLAAEKEENGNARRRAEALHEELVEIRKRMDTVVTTCDQEQRKSSKYELQLSEALEAIADKDDVIEEKEHVLRLVKKENEELGRENQNLRRDVEELRTVYSDLHAAASAGSPHVQADATLPEGNTSGSRGGGQQQEQQEQEETTPEEADDLPTGCVGEPEEEALLCHHCQECFPGITRRELEQHEDSHRVCPFCTMLCDNMDQSVFEDHVYGHEL